MFVCVKELRSLCVCVCVCFVCESLCLIVNVCSQSLCVCECACVFICFSEDLLFLNSFLFHRK